MRRELDLLRRAGITRARFSARYGGQSPRGFTILNAVQTPVGEIEHVWIRPGHWRGPIPRPGAEVSFRAHIELYWREDGSEDLGLFRLEVLR